MKEEFKLQKIRELELELALLKNDNITIPTYQYSRIKDKNLRELVDIERNIDNSIFNTWLNNNISISESNLKYLEDLLEVEGAYIDIYKEEDLKMMFLAPLFKIIEFKTPNSREFYEENIKYENEKFIFNGTVDIVISKGRDYLKKPYFFIQEFKRNEEYGNPRPQLLAELISAVELNSWKLIKGAYITGSIWNFVILEKLGKDKYQYFISQKFDSTKIEDLKSIYKNLVYIKNEIEDIINNEKK
jgi:hypothetical protein